MAKYLTFSKSSSYFSKNNTASSVGFGASLLLFGINTPSVQNRTLTLRGANLLSAVEQPQQSFATRIAELWPFALSRAPTFVCASHRQVESFSLGALAIWRSHRTLARVRSFHV